ACWRTSTLCESFFFQAEDGIRDRNVTGVQTCALPICHLLAGLILLGSKLVVGIATNAFSGRWRYVGVRDAMIVTRAGVLAAVLAFALFAFLDLPAVRLRLAGADAVIYIVLACGMRLAVRSLHEWERR